MLNMLLHIAAVLHSMYCLHTICILSVCYLLHIAIVHLYCESFSRVNGPSSWRKQRSPLRTQSHQVTSTTLWPQSENSKPRCVENSLFLYCINQKHAPLLASLCSCDMLCFALKTAYVCIRVPYDMI